MSEISGTDKLDSVDRFPWLCRLQRPPKKWRPVQSPTGERSNGLKISRLKLEKDRRFRKWEGKRGKNESDGS